jgi:hypothetical protein
MLLLLKGDSMKNLLAMFILLAGTAILVPFSAAKSADTPTVTGKWHFIMDTEGGDRTSDPVFQQDGEKVTGKWDNDNVKGTFTEGKLLNLEFPVNSEEGGPGTLKIKGELAGDSLSGSWSFNDYSGTFKATRVKE